MTNALISAGAGVFAALFGYLLSVRRDRLARNEEYLQRARTALWEYQRCLNDASAAGHSVYIYEGRSSLVQYDKEALQAARRTAYPYAHLLKSGRAREAIIEPSIPDVPDSQNPILVPEEFEQMSMALRSELEGHLAP